MAGEQVGWVKCSECGAESPVRENKNKKVYYLCPECGLIYPNSKEGNARLRAKMRPLTDEKSDPLAEKKGGAEVAGGVAKSSPAPSEEGKKPGAPPEKPKVKFEGFV